MGVQVDRKVGEAIFVLSGCPDAKQVYLVGDFNQWNPARKRMARYRDGSFRAKVNLRPGEYQYKFVADGVWLNDLEAEQQVANPFGSVNSLVTIS